MHAPAPSTLTHQYPRHEPSSSTTSAPRSASDEPGVFPRKDKACHHARAQDIKTHRKQQYPGRSQKRSPHQMPRGAPRTSVECQEDQVIKPRKRVKAWTQDHPARPWRSNNQQRQGRAPHRQSGRHTFNKHSTLRGLYKLASATPPVCSSCSHRLYSHPCKNALRSSLIPSCDTKYREWRGPRSGPHGGRNTSRHTGPARLAARIHRVSAGWFHASIERHQPSWAPGTIHPTRVYFPSQKWRRDPTPLPFVTCVVASICQQHHRLEHTIFYLSMWGPDVEYTSYLTHQPRRRLETRHVTRWTMNHGLWITDDGNYAIRITETIPRHRQLDHLQPQNKNRHCNLLGGTMSFCIQGEATSVKVSRIKSICCAARCRQPRQRRLTTTVPRKR